MKEYQPTSIGQLTVGVRGRKRMLQVFFKTAKKTVELPERALALMHSFFFKPVLSQFYSGSDVVLRSQMLSCRDPASLTAI